MNRPPSTVHRRLPVLLLASYALLLTGCIHRQLTVRSEPPGAALMLNDKAMGKTPVSYDFTWYGSYRVILNKDGYETLHDKPAIKAPWYLWVPLDLAAELWPWPVRDERELSYTLVPREEIPGPTAPTYDEAPEPAATEETDGAAR